jgi:hypothetical protein
MHERCSQALFEFVHAGTFQNTGILTIFSSQNLKYEDFCRHILRFILADTK